MSAIKFLTSPEFGCCQTAELLAMAKIDKPGVETLKQWAREEMANRGIPCEEPVAS